MPHELWIYDVIADDTYGFGVTPSSVRDDLRAMPAKERVLVRINSPGGDVFAAVAIRQHLAERKAGYDVQVDGLAASAATFFLAKGANVAMARGARLMVHSPWGVTIGNAAEHQKNAAVLNGIGDDMIAAYAERTGKTADEVRAVVEAETYFNADDAIAFGLADEQIGMESVAASLDAEAVRACDVTLVAATRARLQAAAVRRQFQMVKALANPRI